MGHPISTSGEKRVVASRGARSRSHRSLSVRRHLRGNGASRPLGNVWLRCRGDTDEPPNSTNNDMDRKAPHNFSFSPPSSLPTPLARCPAATSSVRDSAGTLSAGVSVWAYSEIFQLQMK